MNTAMNYLTVLFVFLLLAAPSLYGIANDRRIDRQLRQARRDAERPSRRAEFTTVA
ncbi:hypothetical protein OHO83_17900 [Streptomyces sp. NBC_00569]|uniref:hypothetical protein n=1 Tax=unclassified Streptomyces TaxID=2593676 RepID=UPI0022562A94|nr:MULTISPECIES: hypothetical protein [unclassified Streptomyces]MCX5439516.1 hypothetical protein [Streptomyces sp. NBC_00063]WUB94033.1 hypothetical protein OHO83_17900 [Streptomyces sp. NBC_00569]